MSKIILQVNHKGFESLVKLTKSQAKEIGLPDPINGEIKGELTVRGSWQIPVKFRAIAIKRERDLSQISHPLKSVTFYGYRTMSQLKQDSYTLDGWVSIEGKKRKGFVSSLGVSIDGEYVEMQVISIIDK